MVEFLDELITLGHCLCRRYLYTTRMHLQYSLTPDLPTILISSSNYIRVTVDTRVEEVE